MAGLNTTGRNLALDSGIGGFAYASLHSGDASTNGANELTGGSPAYARVAITWGSAASGTKSNTSDIEFNVPAGSTVAEVGYWSAPSGGTFYGSRAVTNESFVGQGTYTISSGDIDESAA
jgi:hypothetical protein